MATAFNVVIILIQTTPQKMKREDAVQRIVLLEMTRSRKGLATKIT